jgi:hypothetical protein
MNCNSEHNLYHYYSSPPTSVMIRFIMKCGKKAAVVEDEILSFQSPVYITYFPVSPIRLKRKQMKFAGILSFLCKILYI